MGLPESITQDDFEPARATARLLIRALTESVAKLLSKSNPAVLVRTNDKVTGIVTRSDLLSYMMSR